MVYCVLVLTTRDELWRRVDSVASEDILLSGEVDEYVLVSDVLLVRRSAVVFRSGDVSDDLRMSENLLSSDTVVKEDLVSESRDIFLCGDNRDGAEPSGAVLPLSREGYLTSAEGLLFLLSSVSVRLLSGELLGSAFLTSPSLASFFSGELPRSVVREWILDS